MRCLITCPFGLSSMLGQEMQLLGLRPFDTFATGTYVEVEEWKDVRNINLWSRLANKVSVCVGEATCASFEDMFQLALRTDREMYIEAGQGIEVEVFVHDKEQFDGMRSVQSVVHKGIIQHLVGEEGHREVLESDAGVQNNTHGNAHAHTGSSAQRSLHISVHITGQQVALYINTSGAPLHQRGWRRQTGEAPLKENLAAALVLLSSRKYRELLWDPCCGSGTIPIEAARIARNTAPGLLRSFAFEIFRMFDLGLWQEVRAAAIAKQYAGSLYRIVGSDIDETVLGYARDHAERAGVADTIVWEQRDWMSSLSGDGDDSIGVDSLTSPLSGQQTGYIVSNPPYDKRLALTDKGVFYRQFSEYFADGWKGAILLPYEEETDRILNKLTKKELKNGGLPCRVYRKV